jgi:ketosteroid isomerase-like protein
MDAKETVRTLMEAVQIGDYTTVKSLPSDDFMFSGPVPEPINGEQWLGMSASMKAAFPDLDYHFKVDGNVVKTSTQLSGTHSGDFDLTAMGMGVIPATGKSFSTTSDSAEGEVREGKVVAYRVQPTEGSGLIAILTQLGISVPTK